MQKLTLFELFRETFLLMKQLLLQRNAACKNSRKSDGPIFFKVRKTLKITIFGQKIQYFSAPSDRTVLKPSVPDLPLNFTNPCQKLAKSNVSILRKSQKCTKFGIRSRALKTDEFGPVGPLPHLKASNTGTTPPPSAGPTSHFENAGERC